MKLGICIKRKRTGRAGRLTCALFSLFTLCQAGHLTYAVAAPSPWHLPPLGASSAGVGFANMADADDPATIFWNPAGIAMMNQMAVQLTLTTFDGGRPGSWSVFIANSANREASQFGLALVRRHAVNSSGEFKSVEVLNPLAYKGMRSSWAWGFTPKFVCENYGEKWVYGMKIDAGISYQAGKKTGPVLAVSMQNLAGSNLRAFPWDSWGGLKSGGEDPLDVFFQVRLDKPLDPDYLSQNYRVGARVKLEDTNMPEFRAGLIRERGDVQYTGGLTYFTKNRSNQFEYAIIWNPGDKQSFAHYVTFGYHMLGGTPSSPGKMTW